MRILAILALLLLLPASAWSGVPRTPITTPNGASLPWTMKGGVKEFRLTIDDIVHEVAPGMKVRAWGYNGRTPGPTLEVVQGDRVRFLVKNNLPAPTAVHWHGILLPSGMDGVAGLNQRPLEPGETFAYEFTLDQEPGTYMYHSHSDEMVQIAMGAMGFLILHPKDPRQGRVDRDFALFLNEWHVPVGTSVPEPTEMNDFNLFTFNGRAWPGTEPLVVRTGEKVRLRFANVGQDVHPVHLHGHTFRVTGTDGGPVPPSAQFRETTVLVAPGQTREVILDAAVAGDWAMHCHRRHHPMNAMGHGIPNMLGVDTSGVADEIGQLVPGYMPMGRTGMHGMEGHGTPPNTLPMMAGTGPFGSIGMGGMFTLLKVRDRGRERDEWHRNPPGTVAAPR